MTPKRGAPDGGGVGEISGSPDQDDEKRVIASWNRPEVAGAEMAPVSFQADRSHRPSTRPHELPVSGHARASSPRGVAPRPYVPRVRDAGSDRRVMSGPETWASLMDDARALTRVTSAAELPLE